jgi:pyrroline-5-carboxylate reductase
MATPALWLLGCGKMGQAMLHGWQRLGLAYDITVIDPIAPQALPQNIRHAPTLGDLPLNATPTIMVLAVKPQQFAVTLPQLAKHKNSLFISIAAGITSATIARNIGHAEAAIVRAMPNLPASVGAGISGAFATSSVLPHQREQANQLLLALGNVVWLEDELLLNAITALSGSGPAYFFALTEAMADAGVALGLSRQAAELLARQTLIGAGALAQSNPQTAGQLREAVTSKGGTTAAALAVLQEPQQGLAPLLRQAMQAAMHRAAALSQQT